MQLFVGRRNGNTKEFPGFPILECRDCPLGVAEFLQASFLVLLDR